METTSVRIGRTAAAAMVAAAFAAAGTAAGEPDRLQNAGTGETTMEEAAAAVFRADAHDVETREVYRARSRPGWASWVSCWQDDQGGLYVSFEEITRGRNTLWEPVPPEFWESMALPAGYHETLCNGSKDLVNEIVVLKSEDAGATWKEMSRHNTGYVQSFSWVSLGGGRIGRSMCNDYLAWHPGDVQHTWFETSPDGGRTWARQSLVIECHNGSGCPHRLRKLADGTLAQLVSTIAPFGPGRERRARHTKRQDVIQENMVFMFFSSDEGKTWTGPVQVLQGINAYEPDFVELPSGQLLLLNSTVQGGPQVRQYVKKGPWGWIPGPVYNVVSGRVPECLVYSRGYIVGAVRGGEFTCSDDEGATWHTIAGLAPCGYQPYITSLADGRMFCAWHGGGGDEDFGKKDLYIGATVFRLAANLPKRPTLDIERNFDNAAGVYLNSYTVSLRRGGAPVAGATLVMSYKVRYSERWVEQTLTTDGSGDLVFDLSEVFAGVSNKHLSYELRAEYREDGCKPIAASYFAYAMTSSMKELGW